MYDLYSGKQEFAVRYHKLEFEEFILTDIPGTPIVLGSSDSGMLSFAFLRVVPLFKGLDYGYPYIVFENRAFFLLTDSGDETELEQYSRLDDTRKFFESHRIAIEDLFFLTHAL